MSEEIFARCGLFVTRYVGPAAEGADRQRWKVTALGEYAVLTRNDALDLARAILNDAGSLAWQREAQTSPH